MISFLWKSLSHSQLVVASKLLATAPRDPVTADDAQALDHRDSVAAGSITFGTQTLKLPRLSYMIYPFRFHFLVAFALLFYLGFKIVLCVRDCMKLAGQIWGFFIFILREKWLSLITREGPTL